MINAWEITKFDRSDAELEEFALFCVCVAGKSAETTARGLEKFLSAHLKLYSTKSPFKAIRCYLRGYGINNLAQVLLCCGLGCYRQRAAAFTDLVQSGIDLRTCSTTDLEKLHGWGPKTSRFFLLHSRPGFQGAPLDTHVLKFLRDSGIQNVPKSTPPKGNRYNYLEARYMELCPPWQSLADFDLEVWMKYARPAKELRP